MCVHVCICGATRSAGQQRTSSLFMKFYEPFTHRGHTTPSLTTKRTAGCSFEHWQPLDGAHGRAAVSSILCLWTQPRATFGCRRRATFGCRQRAQRDRLGSTASILPQSGRDHEPYDLSSWQYLVTHVANTIIRQRATDGGTREFARESFPESWALRLPVFYRSNTVPSASMRAAATALSQ